MPDRGQRIVAKGKVTLQQAVDILAKHKETRGEFGQEAIVNQYGLNAAATAGALRHFFIFGMFETNTRKNESVTPDPLVSGKDWVDKVLEMRRFYSMRLFINTSQVKSNVGKDPMRLQTQELDSTLKQLENQKTRAKLEKEKFMLENVRQKPVEGEKPKR